MKLQPPKGTRDFYPEDMHLQNHIFSVWRKTAGLFCFEEYEGPIFEHLELFTEKSGEEITKQLYHFKDKSERDLALRPEITPTLARLMVQKGSSLKKPVKWFSVPRLFRYERTQKGRLREFFQFNLDILGEAGVSADAELMAAATHMMKSFGFSAEDFKIRVNSRKLMSSIFASRSLEKNNLSIAYGLMDKRSKPDEYDAEQKRLINACTDNNAKKDLFGLFDLIDELFSLQELDTIINSPLIKDSTGEISKSVIELKELFKLIKEYGFQKYVVFDVSVVRGLDYYTGIVWEVFDKARNLRAIAGGGRYDNLIAAMGGGIMPAVGFGVGDAVLAELLAEKKSVPPYRKAAQAYIVNFNRSDAGPALKTAALLREQGVSAEFSLRPQSVQKQMDAARHAAYTVFVGGDEWTEGKVKVKDMVKGNETSMDFTALASLFGKKE